MCPRAKQARRFEIGKEAFGARERTPGGECDRLLWWLCAGDRKKHDQAPSPRCAGKRWETPLKLFRTPRSDRRRPCGGRGSLHSESLSKTVANPARSLQYSLPYDTEAN